jgi:hypothetical protein
MGEVDHLHSCTGYPLFHWSKNFRNYLSPDDKQHLVVNTSYCWVLNSRELYSYKRSVSTTTDTIRTYVSAFEDLVLHANTAHIGGSFYMPNQQSSCAQEKYSRYPSRLCIYRRRKEVRRSSTYSPRTMFSFSVEAGNNCKPKARWPLNGPNSGKYISTSVNHQIWELFPHDFREICYTTTTLRHITGKDYSTSIYAHLWAAKHDAPKMRILLQGPSTEWSQVWKNPQNVPINGATRSTCYRTIHDLITTQIRPSRIHHQSSSERIRCHTPDSLLHPFTECKETTDIWRWKRGRLATIQRTDFRYIPTTPPHGCFFPVCQYGPAPDTKPSYGS